MKPPDDMLLDDWFKLQKRAEWPKGYLARVATAWAAGAFRCEYMPALVTVGDLRRARDRLCLYPSISHKTAEVILDKIGISQDDADIMIECGTA